MSFGKCRLCSLYDAVSVLPNGPDEEGFSPSGVTRYYSGKPELNYRRKHAEPPTDLPRGRAGRWNCGFRAGFDLHREPPADFREVQRHKAAWNSGLRRERSHT